MNRRYIAEIDHDMSGELGWKDKRIGWNTPYGPLTYHIGLAHDALEHFGLETVSDEIRAHAVIYWGRYRAGWCQDNGRCLDIDGIGSEWIQLYYAIQGDNRLAKPPRTCKLDPEVEEDISAIIKAGREYLLGEFDNSFDWRDTADTIEAAFRGWFRLGYRQAEGYYRKRLGWAPHDLSWRFEELARAFQRHTPEYEGQELALTIDKNGIRLREVEAEVY